MPPPPRGVTQCGPALGARFTLGHAVYDGGTCFDLLRRRPITPRSASSQDHNLVAARGATRDAPMSNPAHLYLKRAKADQIALGTPGAYRARLAQLVNL
jgi:hypothetical protein